MAVGWWNGTDHYGKRKGGSSESAENRKPWYTGREEVIPVLKREMDYWHNSVGLAEVSEETMDVIMAVARKSYNLVNEWGLNNGWRDTL